MAGGWADALHVSDSVTIGVDKEVDVYSLDFANLSLGQNIQA